MKLLDLKSNLLTNKKIKLPLAMVNKDKSNFLIKDYIKKISEVNQLEIKEVNNLQEVKDLENDVFFENNYLFVYNSNEELKVDEDLIINSNVIVVYQKDIKDINIEYVLIPELIEWQIEDFVKTKVPGLDKMEIQWLCKIAKYNINRLNNEVQKLTIFNKKEQESIFNLINLENGYCDLNELNIFNLSNAIIKKDIGTVKQIIKDIDNIDIEGTGLVTILLSNFLKIINIQLNSKATPSSLNMSEKQFKAIRYNINKFSSNKLINIYRFLNTIDYKLKSGLLNLNNNEIVTYIISNILN